MLSRVQTVVVGGSSVPGGAKTNLYANAWANRGLGGKPDESITTGFECSAPPEVAVVTKASFVDVPATYVNSRYPAAGLPLESKNCSVSNGTRVFTFAI